METGVDRVLFEAAVHERGIRNRPPDDLDTIEKAQRRQAAGGRVIPQNGDNRGASLNQCS